MQYLVRSTYNIPEYRTGKLFDTDSHTQEMPNGAARKIDREKKITKKGKSRPAEKDFMVIYFTVCECVPNLLFRRKIEWRRYEHNLCKRHHHTHTETISLHLYQNEKFLSMGYMFKSFFPLLLNVLR